MKTVLVAGYDAPPYIKDVAEYICDGIDDQVEVNAAIDYVARYGGGYVRFVGLMRLTGTIEARADVSFMQVKTGNFIPEPRKANDAVLE